MEAGVFGQFGVEGGGHGAALADGNGIGAFSGEDFDAFADTLNFRGADENHFEGRFGGLVGKAGEQLALADGAVDLASVSVAADADVEGAESGLRGIFDLGGEQDGAGAGAEGRFEADELFELFESGLAEEFEEGAGLASGNDEPINVVELLWLFDEHNLGAELLEPAAVGIEIALQGQDTDDHGGGLQHRGTEERLCNSV